MFTFRSTDYTMGLEPSQVFNNHQAMFTFSKKKPGCLPTLIGLPSYVLWEEVTSTHGKRNVNMDNSVLIGLLIDTLIKTFLIRIKVFGDILFKCT